MKVTSTHDAFDRGDSQITFGDNVRVCESQATEEAGVAGKSGVICGETTPSVSSVTVIGTLQNDFALMVELHDSGHQFWITPDLLEFVDHGAGTTFSLAGASTTWTRNERGEWEESTPGLFARIIRWLKRSK